MKQFFKHLKTVLTHKHVVFKMCCKCGIFWQGITHDLSKFSPVEFFAGVKYWSGKHSPIDDEIIDKGYSAGWLHHEGHNKHHFTYWVDVAHGIYAPMPRKYLVEMFCDRVGASKTYLGDKYTDAAPYDYAIKTNLINDSINSQTYDEIMFLLEMLKNDGEEKTCKYIKKNFKKRG